MWSSNNIFGADNFTKESPSSMQTVSYVHGNNLATLHFHSPAFEEVTEIFVPND